MADETVEFNVAPRGAEDGAPGAVASFPFDRATVDRFREAFPRARWREDLGGWFVPGKTAERRLRIWSAQEWRGALAHADQRGRDAYEFEPITSPFLEVGDDFVVRTPYSRTVVAALREVPWAHWDPVLKAWRVPFRSYEDLRRHWSLIEDAARLAEPEARRQRKKERAASPDAEEKRSSTAERRRQRYPVPADTAPPLDKVLMTHIGGVMFTMVTGELVEPDVSTRFYPGVLVEAATLVWAAWRRPSHSELIQAWPARSPPSATDLARGWWQPTIEELRPERRKAASEERGRATRKFNASASDGTGC
ncbi:hypothetical protein EJV46_01200 [Roseococcus sp. SYP-B2431]|uniref:hypothetical protein n=1 Tax=Roseococcus sp. SYP-B2431 TaxID=2496640 RepID=UPI00103E4D2A|nr:hypothetical protein [Roseococcus sp. SYP-B2431]TCI00713.1 hypothetical protein EJV46_01200 [Roseococcus sp. SYP-B2431]